MKKQLSDEQLDTLVRKLMKDASADEATITEVAGSPTVWWAVQRNINSQRAASLSAWPPLSKMLRWVIVGLPVAAVLLISFFIFRPLEPSDNIASSIPSPVSKTIVDAPSVESRLAPPSVPP